MDETERSSISTLLVIGGMVLLGIGAFFVIANRHPSDGPVANGELPPPPPPMCLTAITGTTTAYNRPSKDASKFGEITPVQIVQVAGKTEDGWIGFEPGSAQAPNVGLLRLRWLPPETPNDLSPDCGEVPMLPTLAPSGCYVMTHGTATVYKTTSTSSDAIETFSEDFREATAKKEVNGSPFYQVEALTAAASSTESGWVSGSEVDLNGDCDF